MRVLGLVTARGGSKGFPGKNLARLAGRPLVAWSHRALAGLRDRRPGLVLRLSTDCPDIAAAWPEADRPEDLRPAGLAGDHATSLSVVEYELERMRARGEPCDAVLLLQPTSPLLNTDDLDGLWDAFERFGGSVAVATPLEHPHQWLFRPDERYRIEPVGEWSTGRRQDDETALRPVGCYMTSADFIARHRGFLEPGHTAMAVVPRSRAVDIDEPGDLDLAESLLGRARTGARIELGTRAVGEGEPVFVIAEAGVNHNGDPGLAARLVDAAADAGADAVKFQTFNVATLVSATAAMAAYQRRNIGARGTQAAMLESLRLAHSELPALKRRAEDRGLVFLSSPFDRDSALLLRDLGVPAFKVGSGELTNHPLLGDIAGLGLPMLVSTGMGTLDEVEDAAVVIGRAWTGEGPAPVAWLHCVSAYPAPEEASNLAAMDAIRLTVGGPVGMSDHSMGWAVTLAAVARGARVIEKHLTLDRSMEGPDHAASLEPVEFAEMTRQVRLVESALGDGVKRPAACETDTISAARRSLVAARDLPAGHVLSPGDLVCKRPGTGMPPSKLDRVLGRALSCAVAADEVLAPDSIE
jgi:N,N'-diacetyllegionaminate synthase